MCVCARACVKNTFKINFSTQLQLFVERHHRKKWLASFRQAHEIYATSTRNLPVHLQQAVGSGGEGLIVCYQTSNRVPVTLSSLTYTELTAIFQMTIGSGINCCSSVANEDVSPATCADFVFQEQVTQSITPTTEIIKISQRENEVTGKIRHSVSSKAYIFRGERAIMLTGIVLSNFL